MKFKLEIELGNDAMLTYNDIAEGLNDVLGYIGGDEEPTKGESGTIPDRNGNTVGKWEIK